MKTALLLCFIALSASLSILTPKKHYIVVFNDGLSEETMEAHRGSLGDAISANYSIGTSFFGFAAHLDLLELQHQKGHPNVKFVEEDQVVTALQTCTSQSGATWGLTRVSERTLNLNGIYKYNNGGQGVTSYIVDTGILTTHVDFGGRAVFGANYAGDGQNTDCNGHGTHVAGTVGGTTYGIAKKTTLVAVKVLNCAGSGSNTGVISGVQYVSKNGAGKPSVANLSLGGSYSAALNQAVAAAVKAGIPFVVAAGNENQNACNTSPASEPLAITVGATDNRDARSSFSNWGTCLDIFGPGSNIVSDWYTSNTATYTASGTSMASPHVAGVAALILGQNPGATPAQVQQQLTNAATNGIIKFNCGNNAVCDASPNSLLYSSC
jgi:subtilisin family serine protease